MTPETLRLIESVDLRRGHPFFPPADEWANVPTLYATESVLTRDKLVVLHYFVGNADWWIVEADHDSRVAFGFACLGDPASAEWGYIDLAGLAVMFRSGAMSRRWVDDVEGEVVTVRPPIIVERDLYWTVRPAGEVEGIKIPEGGR